METALDTIFIFATTVLLSVASVKMLHMYQLSSYRLRGVVSWLKISHFEYLLRYFSFAFFATGITLLFNFCFPYENVHYFSYLFLALFGILFCVLSLRKSKVPLALTPRMIRLIMTNVVVTAVLAVGGWGLSLTPMMEAGYCVLPALIPFSSLISYGITYPIERLIAKSFIKDATEEIDKMKRDGLKVVGITGSYGKTTAKNILLCMLSTKYRVCASPGSYNTPLGICRTVNDSLAVDDEILIAEMGARRPGDIKELCEVAKPDFALITGVGSQHLETFGSLEAIADTKYELIEGLSEGGIAVFNTADHGAAKLSERLDSENKTLAGEGEDSYAYYSDVSFGSFGCQFKLTCCGETLTVKTKLLGRHIPALICACTALASKMEVPLCACVRACEKLAPIPHRLELIVSGEKTILDDAYNSNTAGAENAVEMLGYFEGLKVIVTPGIVELGDMEADANRRFGGQIAAVCDRAIFVGARAKFLCAGAEDAGMLSEKISVVSSLKEAQALLAEITEKAVILFENDLPDNY